MAPAHVLTPLAEVAGEEAVSQTVTLTVIEGGASAAEAGGAVVAAEVVGLTALEAVAIGTGVGLVVVGLGLLGYWLYTSSQDDAPKASAPVQPCPPDEVPCFNPPPDADKEEYARQLKEQQDALNDMSPDEYLGRRARFNDAETKRSQKAQRQKAQREKRREYQKDKTAEYYNDNIAKDMTAGDARTDAMKRVADEMRELDATHALDMVAGGDPEDISGLGDRSINRSIGSQWKDRVGKLDEIAEKAKREGKEKLDVELKLCD